MKNCNCDICKRAREFNVTIPEGAKEYMAETLDIAIEKLLPIIERYKNCEICAALPIQAMLAVYMSCMCDTDELMQDIHAAIGKVFLKHERLKNGDIKGIDVNDDRKNQTPNLN